jgi:hypothetical protein
MRKSGRKTKKPGRKTGRSKKTKSTAKRAPARRAQTKRGRKAPKKKKPLGKKKRAVASRRARRGDTDLDFAAQETRGLGSDAGGQSGDTEGLSRAEIEDSERVEELVEEGQAFEAAAISGVEDAPDADQGEVRTRQVPEDDVPEEYLPDKE